MTHETQPTPAVKPPAKSKSRKYLFTVEDADGNVLQTDKNGVHLNITVRTPDGKVHKLREIIYNLYMNYTLRLDGIVGEIDGIEFEKCSFMPSTGQFEREFLIRKE
jgi:hypothetical protein